MAIIARDGAQALRNKKAKRYYGKGKKGQQALEKKAAKDWKENPDAYAPTSDSRLCLSCGVRYVTNPHDNDCRECKRQL